jgi:hypothetical protein
MSEKIKLVVEIIIDPATLETKLNTSISLIDETELNVKAHLHESTSNFVARNFELNDVLLKGGKLIETSLSAHGGKYGF